MADDVINTVLAALSKKKINNARTLAEGSRSAIVECIPTGIHPIDHHVIGCGGIPVGRITELYSEEGGGKSSLVYQLIAQTQKLGGTPILIETENALHPERVKVFGVDLEKLIVIEPDFLEQALEQLVEVFEALPADAGPVFIGWDSLAATPTKEELKSGLVGGQAVADKARIMSRACRTLTSYVAGKRIAMLIVNQTRTKMGVMFGDNTITPGGAAMKFTASLRLRISGGKAIKDDNGDHVGKDILISAWKNRLGVPYNKCRVRLNYTIGFDNEWSVLDFGKDREIIKPRSRGKKAYAEVLASMGWEDGN